MCMHTILIAHFQLLICIFGIAKCSIKTAFTRIPSLFFSGILTHTIKDKMGVYNIIFR